MSRFGYLGDPKPEPNHEAAFRETFLHCFNAPEIVEQLRRLGDTFYYVAMESPFWDWGASHGLSTPRGNATAAAADLERLADYLQMVAEQPASLGVAREDLPVCRAAAGWAGRLRRLVDDIREEVGEGPEDDDQDGEEGEDDAAQVEYEALLAEEGNEEVATMEMSWAEKIESKGIEKGRQEGIEEGQMQGMRVLLANLLELRFGPLSAEVQERLRAIQSADELSRLHRRALDAESLGELGL